MSDVASRRLEMLGEFAELLLATAHDLHAAGLAAEDLGEKARLADSLHRTGRGLRQTLALQARLEREDQVAVMEDAARATRETQAHRTRRKTQAKAAIERLVWTEYEPDDTEAEDLLDRLDLILAAECELDDFLTEDPAEQVARLCEAVGYQPPSPLAGEGVVRSATDEGSHGDRPIEATDPPAKPLIRPDGHLLPQGEKANGSDPVPSG